MVIKSALKDKGKHKIDFVDYRTQAVMFVKLCLCVNESCMVPVCLYIFMHT